MNSSCTLPYLNEDDNVGSTVDDAIFFGNDKCSSFGGSEHCAYLGGIFDRSSSFDLDIETDSEVPFARNSIAVQRTLSHNYMMAKSYEEKENDSDTIRDDIMFIHHKTSILRRASHMSIQQQQEYHMVASYHAQMEEVRRNPMNDKISIWDEAKYFLQSENESPDDIGMGATGNHNHAPAPQSEFHNVTASMKSLSAVQQYCDANRSDQQKAVAAVSSGARSFVVGPDGDAIQQARIPPDRKSVV